MNLFDTRTKILFNIHDKKGEEYFIYYLKKNNFNKAYAHNYFFVDACRQGRLDICIKLQFLFNFIKEDITHNIYNSITQACLSGNLEICKWLYRTFDLIKDDFIIKDNFCFRYACLEGYLDICKWLYFTFNLKKNEINIFNHFALLSAVNNDHFNIVQFLFQETNLLTEDDAISILDKVIIENNKKKLLEYAQPIGCFTKPVKI